MKRLFAGIVAALAAVVFGAVGVAAPFGNGWGWSGSVGTGTVYKTSIEVDTLSVYNQGVVLLFARVNCASGDLATAISAGTAVVIPTNSVFTFDMKAHGLISSLALATTNLTAQTYVSGF